MKNSFGNNISLTIFGESHGASVGFVLDGIAPGIPVDEENIKRMLSLRRPIGDISTSRQETDEFTIQSGIFNGYTTGTPICITIPNKDVKSNDYETNANIARPSHADYTAQCKYGGFQDYRGGGHFSGRLTAALVVAGGILIPALNKKGIFIGTHIKNCGNVSDIEFTNYKADIEKLQNLAFAVLSDEKSKEMQTEIQNARAMGDSVGGTLETAIIGVEAGIGEPWFDSVEGVLSHALFSIPGVKGVEFGLGFGFANEKGSTANDSFCVNNGEIQTKTNNSGGINGGITNGMPIVFSCAFRPTPTISKPQETVDFVEKENKIVEFKGRHDPCILHRARVVVDSISALVIADLLASRYGTDWLAL